ncbi:MAG: extracellular solute-binding protein [Lachnospiraceae bacterium]|nr:extracellular solute-binding protein [Lachnospiraceae bacterium]
MKKRLTAVAVILLAMIYIIVLALIQSPVADQSAMIQNLGGFSKETILVWYSDEVLADYISSAAVAFNEEEGNQHYRILPVLVPGLEYLEAINRASVAGEEPDLYIIGHDSLEKAYLSGLATEITLAEGLTAYPAVGLNAVTYHDKVLGYPFYFETSALLYNKTYLRQMAEAQIQAELDEAAALAAQEELAEGGPTTGDEAGEDSTGEGGEADETQNDPAILDPAVVEERINQLLPRTLADMKSVADNYDAPEQVEAVFKWDVSDIFYNYFFVGNTMVVGGEAGDDTSNVDIYNPEAINSMKMYQNLSQFFAIDTNEVRYSDVIAEFMAGKLVFTVATTDVVATLEQATAEGSFNYEYGIIRTPDIDEHTPTRSLSMTSCVVINGYSEHQEVANRFALYLTRQQAGDLYARSGKVAAATGINFEYDNLNRFTEEYARSIPLPKMIETSNFWVQLEAAFARIWDGANANSELKELSEQIMTQIVGEPFTEELIIEETEVEQVEYLDEDALRQEALETGNEEE